MIQQPKISEGTITSDNLIICSNDFKSSKIGLNQVIMWIITLKKNVLNFAITAFSDFNNKRLNFPILLSYFATSIISPLKKKPFHKLLRGSLTHIKKVILLKN